MNSPFFLPLLRNSIEMRRKKEHQHLRFNCQVPVRKISFPGKSSGPIQSSQWNLVVLVVCVKWTKIDLGFPGGSVVNNPPANAAGLIPGLGRFSGEGTGNPFQYSCLGNYTDRGSWWATVHGVTKSRTRLSDWTTTK